MKVHLWAMGASSEKWIAEGEQIYVRRIEHYMPFEYMNAQPGKSSSNKALVLSAEAKWIRQQNENAPAKMILLDQKGSQFSSEQFANKLQQWRQGSHKRLVFLIGSAYGYDPLIYDMADELLGLSAMTLPHQLCRIVFLNNYTGPALSSKGESYHHI